jgi:hypothetical protein
MGLPANRSWKGEDGMNVKHVGLCALVLTLLGVSAVRAEDSPPAMTSTPYAASTSEVTPQGDMPSRSTEPHSVPQLSQWILGPTCECCGPLGGNTLGYEIYLRTGLSLPFGSGVLAKDLDPGWVVHGGARVLFFNPSQTSAWTVDFGVMNIYNHADGDHKATLENIIVPGPANIFGQATSQVLPTVDVTFNRYNRTFATMAFGKEWYLWDPAHSCEGWMWRAGLDAGFRYGTSKLDLNELRHRTKVIGAPTVSLHTDLELPWGACIYQIGFRAEWSFTFSEILQDQNDADVHDILLMLNLGVRF